MDRRAFDLVDEATLAQYVESGAAENQQLDFKETQPGHDHGSKREFLSDASSFANAAGGMMILGIKEEDGIAVEVRGVELPDADAEVLRLESLLRDCIEPRLPAQSIRAVPLRNGRKALIVWVPRSWIAPHAVNFEKHWRFYSRNSAGKYRLDVQGMKNLVLTGEAAAENVRRFRTERLARIVAKETPVDLAGEARLVVQLVPLRAMAESMGLEIGFLLDQESAFWPLHHTSVSNLVNLDGLVRYSPHSDSEMSAYVQAFRTGAVELVDGELLSREHEGRKVFPVRQVEKVVLEALPKLFAFFGRLDGGYPLVVMISMFGVQGGIFWPSYHDVVVNPRFVRERDILLPELVIDELPKDAYRTMRPSMDLLWNVGGSTHSPSYDNAGTWTFHQG